jgi:hypothetical protein
LAIVPEDVRWPSASAGSPNIRARSRTTSFSSSLVAGPPSSAWLFGFSSIAAAYAAAATGCGGLSICPA